MKRYKSIISLFVIVVIMSQHLVVFCFFDSNAQNALYDTAQHIYTTVPEPQIGSIGGEWTVFGLARSGYDAPPEYYDNYYARVEEYVRSNKGVLHSRKFTEYSRLIVTLTAIGKDPSDVAGYNLLMPLGDYDGTLVQGINGPIWALIALDCGNYEIPINPDATTQATREMYVDCILSRQLTEGGFALRGVSAGVSADADITGMAIQALSNYTERPDVKEAIERALRCLSDMQNENGGFSSWGEENSESCVQAIVALCEMGIPIDDPRFVKNGNTLLDNLMTYYIEGQGFNHTKDNTGSNLMASEQGLYALAAVKRLANNEKSLYNITDEEPKVEESIPSKQLLNILIKMIYSILI